MLSDESSTRRCVSFGASFSVIHAGNRGFACRDHWEESWSLECPMGSKTRNFIQF